LGASALTNDTGAANTANGALALFNNTSGNLNTALGAAALYSNTTGSNNIAIGEEAGYNVTGDNNIDVGYNVVGVAGESNTIRIGNGDVTDVFIRGISGTTIASGDAVFVASNGHLGTITSSARFKDEIKPMNKASEALFSLNPVTFRYKKEIDPAGISQFGLVAEEVEKVNPDLVTHNQEGTPHTVRYEQINAMLLNEFLKEHRAFLEEHQAVQEQGATIAELKEQIASLTTMVEEQAAQIQKVSTQFELRKPASQTVASDQ
jgi:hypothetical protein